MPSQASAAHNRQQPALRLSAAVHESSPLAPQVASLTNLQLLVLCGGGGAGYCDSLTRLAALTVLTLERSYDVPTCLQSLTQLLSLDLIDTPRQPAMEEEMELREGWVAQELELVLAQLTGLTRLWLENPPPAAAFPASLMGLRQFGWLSDSNDDSCLPPGPWLAGLQQLSLRADVAEGSAAAWQQATQLTCLRLQDFFDSPTAAPPASRRRFSSDAAAALLCLRTLCLECAKGCAPAAEANLQCVTDSLHQHSPQLAVKLQRYESDPCWRQDNESDEE